MGTHSAIDGVPFHKLKRIGYSDVLKIDAVAPAVVFHAGMTIDADGAYRAYHPDSKKGLDYLANAGRPGKWWGVVTGNGNQSGTPVVQSTTDPAPGFFVSATALVNPDYGVANPRRYVDSESVPFLVLPGGSTFGAELGDFGYVVNFQEKRGCGAVFADIGPRDHIGEGSIALAKALCIPSNPRKGGVTQGVGYVVFTGSRSGWPLTNQEIEEQARSRFEQWGGMVVLSQLLQGWSR